MHLLKLFCVVFLLLNAATSAAQTMPSAEFPFHVELTDLNGSKVQSDQVFGQNDGKVTVLAFWLSTCMPCKHEFAAYAGAYADWQKEKPFRLVAISIDFSQNFPKAQAYAQAQQFPFPVYWDANRAFKQLLPGGLNGLPQVFVFDAGGKLVWQHKGYAPGAENELWEVVKGL